MSAEVVVPPRLAVDDPVHDLEGLEAALVVGQSDGGGARHAQVPAAAGRGRDVVDARLLRVDREERFGKLRLLRCRGGHLWSGPRAQNDGKDVCVPAVNEQSASTESPFR